MPVLTPPDSGELSTTLARDWAVQVNTGTSTSPTWVFVRGLSQISPSIDPTMQDDSDLDSQGFGSQFTTGQSFSLELAGNRKGLIATSTFTADPGQEFLRAKGALVGANNIANIRWWRTDGLPDAYTGNVAVAWKDTGGGTTDLQGFTSTLSGRGKPNPITKPTATA